jgi:hypothetical protein
MSPTETSWMIGRRGPHRPARLICGDRHEPAADVGRFLDVANPTPGDRPGRLSCVLRQAGVAADDVGNAQHVLVVARDELSERPLVASRGGLHEFRDADRHHAHHAIEIRAEAGLIQMASSRRWMTQTCRLNPRWKELCL